MRAYIGDRLLKSVKPADKPYEIRDTKLTGFVLRVQPSGRISYVAQLGRGKRRTVGPSPTLTPAQARERAKALLAGTVLGEDVDADTRKKQAASLKGYLLREYGPWVKANRKDGTATLARLQSCFGSDLGRKKLPEITPWLIEKWRTRRRKQGVRAATLNRDVGALKAALHRAVEWGLLDEHPLKSVKPLKTDDMGKVRYLSADEERRLRGALEVRDARLRAERVSGNQWRAARGREPLPALDYGDHLTPAVLVSLNTGLRRGELLALRWDNVNLPGKSLTVEGETAKSARTRHIPLNQEAVALLRRWKAQTGGEGLVFASRDGKRMDNMKTAWRALLNVAGIQGFRWHDMRHHFASALVMKGADLYVIKELLGHSTIAVTERYAHLAPEHKAAAVALLDAE